MADGRVVIDVILDDGRAVKGIANVSKSLGNFGKTVQRGVATVGKLAGALGLVSLAYKGIDMIKKSLDGAIDRYDTLNNFPRIMQQLGFDAATSNKAIKRLSDGIQGLPTRLDEIAKSAQSIALMTNDLDLAVETALALNNAFIASGSSTADAERGLTQYVQMLAKGKPDAQSWYTLLETMGPALNKVAEAFGFTGASAKNDLYEALKEGHITFDEFNAKIIELNNAQGGFAEMAQTSAGGIRTAITNMRTWFVMGVTDILKAIDEALGGTGSLEKAINSLKPIVLGFFSIVASMIPIIVQGFRNIIEAVQPWVPSLTTVVNVVKNTFATIYDTVINILQGQILPFIKEQLDGILQFWQENGDQIMKAVQNAFQFIKGVIETVMPVVQFIINMAWEAIKSIISGALSTIQGLIKVFTGIFTGDFSMVWEGIKNIFKGAIDIIIGWMSLSFLGGIRTILTNLLKSGTNIVKGMWESIVGFFRNFGTNVTNITTNLVTKVLGFFENLVTKGVNIFGTLRTLGANVWNALREAILGVVRSIVQGVTSHFNNLFSSARNIMHSIRTTIVDVWNKIKDFLKGINLYQIGRDIIKGLINGVGSMASDLYNKAKNLANGAIDSIKKTLGIASPSKVMIEIGEWTGEGFEEGLNQSIKGVLQQARALAQAVVPELQLPSRILFEHGTYDTGNVGKPGGDIIQNITINSPQPLSPSEIARKTRQSSQLLALEWGMR